MQIDALTILFLARELEKSLRGCRVLKSHDQRSGSAIFLFAKGKERKTLEFHGNPSMQLLYISPSTGKRGKISGAFSERFSRAAEDARVLRVKTADGDRVIRIDLAGVFRDTLNNRRMFLTFYLTGSGSNILLEDEETGNRICSLHPPGKLPQVPAFLLPLEGGLPEIFFPQMIDKKEVTRSLHAGDEHSLAKALRPAVYGGSYPLAFEIAIETFKEIERKFSEHSRDLIGSEPVLLVSSAVERTREKLENMELLGEPIAVRTRQLPGGGTFFPVPASSLMGFDDAEIIRDSSISVLQKRIFDLAASTNIGAAGEVKAARDADRAAGIVTSLRKLKKKLHKRLSKQENDLEESKNAGSFREMGELLLSNAHLDLKGRLHVDLERLSGEGGVLRINLDPSQTTAMNARRYFKKARKLKDRVDITNRRKSETESLILRVGELLDGLEIGDTPGLIEAAKTILEQESPSRGIKAATHKTDTSRSVFKQYNLQTGWELLVGKTASDNDILTFKIAKPGDLWLHAQGTTGSHAIIPCTGKKTPPPADVIRKAAEIAAFFSAAKHSALVPVAYTERRFVRKIRRAPPGTVTFSRVKTLFVTPLNPASR